MATAERLKVFITHQDGHCGECGEELGKGRWITLAGELGALCLGCGDLDHLEFLPSGNAALTRRANRYSKLVAVVLKFSRTRKRYERQGLLVERQAIDKAEIECLGDAIARARRREREAARRAARDDEHVARFAKRLRQLYPGCPTGTEDLVAEHACQKYSGRVGRSAAAKALDERAVRLAMAAHIRHEHTPYDELLSQGMEQPDARIEVRACVDEMLRSWEAGDPAEHHALNDRAAETTGKQRLGLTPHPVR